MKNKYTENILQLHIQFPKMIFRVNAWPNLVWIPPC